MYVSNELMEQQPPCLYFIKVRTAWDDKAGTDAKVALQIFDKTGNNFVLDDLARFGIMGSYHNYFERNNVDFFQVSNKCLNPCRIFVSCNGPDHAEWHLDSIEITVTGSVTTRVGFPATVWVAQGYPYTVDNCLQYKKYTSHDNSSLS